jgi:hypothetical protein
LVSRPYQKSLHLSRRLHLLRRVGNNNYPQVCSPRKLAQAVGS